jgi:hypothetical protein
MRNPLSTVTGRRTEPPSAYHEPAPGPAPAADSPRQSPSPAPAHRDTAQSVDLELLRDQLTARVAELQWDLGGLVYEMAIRDRIRVDVLVRRAAQLQDADSELGEVERILRMEHTGTAGTCSDCGAPHSTGAVFCWQCGHSLLEQVPSASIGAP